MQPLLQLDMGRAVEEILAYCDRLCYMLQGVPFFLNYADTLTVLELINYYLSLAISSAKEAQ